MLRYFKYFIPFVLLIITSCNNKDRSFTLVLLPDTQCYSESYPEIFRSQTSWIADHADSITFVLQQGDITNHNTAREWQEAAKAFGILDGKVPYTFVPGNHDLGDSGTTDTRNADLMNKYLPYGKYSKKADFGGAFETGKMENTWHEFNTGGQKWLILSLEFGPRNEVLSWAGDIISRHPESKVIINTHAYLYSDNQLMSDLHHHKWIPQDYPIGKDTLNNSVNNGQQMWDKLVKRHPNVVFVFCGHVLNDGTGLLMKKGDHGNMVYQFLANFQCGVQDAVNGGNGFLRIIKVNPADSTISVKSYSPWLDEYKHSADQEFTLTKVGI